MQPVPLLVGDAAAAALQQLLRGGPLAVAAEPQAAGTASPQAPQLLAFAGRQGRLLCDARQTPQLRPLLQQAPFLCAYDAKRLHRRLRVGGLQGPARWGCLRLCEQLLQAGGSEAVDLEALARRHLRGALAPAGESLAGLVAHAADLAHIVEQQIALLQQEGLQQVSKLEAAAVGVVADMEHVGMPFVAAEWEALATRNERAQRQAAEALALHLGADPAPLTSDAAILAALAHAGHRLDSLGRSAVARLPPPMATAVQALRQLLKLTQAYGRAFLQHVQSDGRVHATFEQCGASSGRMACHSPNLQAMVQSAAHRRCFAPAASELLVGGDYQACELRILAQISGDPVFCHAFAAGQDVHAEVATLLFERPVTKASAPELRQTAKVVSFGLAYGMGERGLASTLGVSVARAEELLQRYRRRFPHIDAALRTRAAEALQRGEVRTLMGRRLNLRPLLARDPAAATRVAKNMPIQGSNADLVKLALAEVGARLSHFTDAAVVNCIHDEILVQCAKGDADGVADALRSGMLAAARRLHPDVPAQVDLHRSPTWSR